MATDNNTKQKKPAKKQEEAAGVYIYVGPSIRGLVQTAAIYTGTPGEIGKKLKSALEAVPEIAELLVPASELNAAKAQLKARSGGIWAAYQAATKHKKEE